jgi:NAD-reducing hydrogenase large subunit
METVLDHAQDGLRLFHDFHEQRRGDVDGFAPVPALNMGLVGADGNVDYYDGTLRVVGADREVVTEFDGHDYLEHFSEAVEEWSYLKFPFLKAFGRADGSVRVGSLARMNVTRGLSTPLADAEVRRFHAYTDGRANAMTLHGNWARAIEMLHAAEVIRDLLHDPDLQGSDLVVDPGRAAWTGEGIGVVEAPRGTLIHHYRADDDGAITSANLIVATTQNNEVLNRTVRAVAEQELTGEAEITEGMMNAIEVGIRAYDPCLSCATHALGQMPLIVEVYDAAGELVAERVRG